MKKLVKLFPHAAPTLLAHQLWQPGAHLDEAVSHALFSLGKPHDLVDRVVAEINGGRKTMPKEKLEAFARSLCWPGHKKALAILDPLAKGKDLTLDFLRSCKARVNGAPAPKEPTRPEPSKSAREEFINTATAFLAGPQIDQPQFSYLRDANRLAVGVASTLPQDSEILAKLIQHSLEQKSKRHDDCSTTPLKRGECDRFYPYAVLLKGILRGLIVKPRPQSPNLATPLLAHSETQYLAALAIARADVPRGVLALIESLGPYEHLPEDLWITYYTGENFHHYGQTGTADVKAWFEKFGNSADFLQRLKLVNASAEVQEALTEYR